MGSQNSKIRRLEIQSTFIIKSSPYSPEQDITAYGTIIDTEMNAKDSSKGSQRTMNVVVNGHSVVKAPMRKNPLYSKPTTLSINRNELRKAEMASKKQTILRPIKFKSKQNPKEAPPPKPRKYPAPETREGLSFAIEKSQKILAVLVRKRMKETMLKHMEYIIGVLQLVSEEKAKKFLENDVEPEEVLSEVENKDVKDWLTMTFTRSQAVFKRPEDRLHFRGVATAIRAGIVVDRIYRRMSSGVGVSVPPDVLMQMKDIDEWEFDIFRINEIGDGHALKYIGLELFKKHNLINKFKLSNTCLEAFLLKMEAGYSKHNNPYHNLVHAADVAHTTHCLITSTDLLLWLTDLEIFAVITSALIHDYEHTGTTNAFQINTKSDLAYLYNDRNVLENHHASASFTLLKDDANNILSTLSNEEFKMFRSLVVDIVLATDMSFHFQQLKVMKGLLATPENIDKSKALSLLVHCADISHPAKKWELHKKWTDVLVEEFFRQGDRESELGLTISPLCDRKTTVIAISQTGFIDFIVDPSFQVLGDMLDQLVVPLREHKPEDADPKAEAISPQSSYSSTSKLHEEIYEKFKVDRYWSICLQSNKSTWQNKAARDKEAAEIEALRQKLESPSPAAEDAFEKKEEDEKKEDEKGEEEENKEAEPDKADEKIEDKGDKS